MGLFDFLFASGKLKALQEENNSLRLQNQNLRNKIYELEKELYHPSESSVNYTPPVPVCCGSATAPQPGEAAAAPSASAADGSAIAPAASASGSPKVVRHGKIDRRYNEQLDGAGDPSCPLYQKVIRITGTFEQIGLTRDQVAEECKKRGAESAREGICKSMDILIMGNNAGPSKMQKVQEWRAQGLPIQVLNQLELKEIFDKFQT